MRPRFVFHIGPIKTGSTSIQSFLEKEDKINPNIEYKRINPDHFFDLTNRINSEKAKQYFNHLFKAKTQRGSGKSCIFSHECMYQRPENISRLTELARDISDDVSVIGYVRQQSRHYRSHYSQFLYFSKEIQDKVSEIFKQNHLNQDLFTGLEAFLAALCLSDFAIVKHNHRDEYQNWRRMIQISDKLIPSNTELLLGVVPRENYKFSLIEDFCQKAGISRTQQKDQETDIHTHKALPDAAVEILNQAARSGLHFPSKKPEHLKCFEAFRSKKHHNSDLKLHDTKLIESISNYIDSYYLNDNEKVCRKFNLPINYFQPPEKTTKQETVNLIIEANTLRSKNPTERIHLSKQLIKETVRYFLLSEHAMEQNSKPLL